MAQKLVNSPQLLWLPLLMVLITSSTVTGAYPAADMTAKTAMAEAPAVLEPEQIEHQVSHGDSLAKVAAKYKVNLSDLKSWNKDVIKAPLQPGDKLVIKKVDYPAVEGLASWYGPGFHGQNMANGQVYDMNTIVVAHRTLPLGRKVKVTNLENGKSLIAPVLDRGPYVKNSQGVYTREIDLSYAVAQELGTIKKGVVLALIEPLPEPWPAK